MTMSKTKHLDKQCNDDIKGTQLIKSTISAFKKEVVVLLVKFAAYTLSRSKFTKANASTKGVHLSL